jgi:hypothetical protein
LKYQRLFKNGILPGRKIVQIDNLEDFNQKEDLLIKAISNWNSTNGKLNSKKKREYPLFGYLSLIM